MAVDHGRVIYYDCRRMRGNRFQGKDEGQEFRTVVGGCVGPVGGGEWLDAGKEGDGGEGRPCGVIGGVDNDSACCSV